MDYQELVALARDYTRQKSILKLASLFKPEKVVGFEKIRLGSEADGGYVMLDDFKDIGLALSFGVDINAEWDLDVAGRGVRVQQYDHSVTEAPVEHPLIVFFNQMITATGINPDANSIANIVNEGGVSQLASVILKIDIESAEWDVFDALSPEHL